MNPHKLILDADTGIDDALALAYLATFDDVELLGAIGTYGNVAADTAVRNTAYVLELLGFHGVPVLRGSKAPSWAAAFIPDAGCAQFHGTDGLGGFGPASDWHMTNPAPDCMSDSGESDMHTMHSLISVGGYDVHDPHANPAVDSFSFSFASIGRGTPSDRRNHTPAIAGTRHSPALSAGVRFIIDAVRRYGSDATVVATGPLTDIDAALTAAPDIARHLKLVMMGGTLTQEGNCWDLVAETNVIQDPEAANRVFHSGADITMVGLDVTHQCLLGGDATRRWREAAASLERSKAVRVADSPASPPSPNPQHALSPQALCFLADIADFSIAANLKADSSLFAAGMPLHDPLAAAVAIDPALVSCIDLPMKVETQNGDFHGTRGRTIGDPKGLIDPSAPRVHVSLHVDAKRFIGEFAARIAGTRH